MIVVQVNRYAAYESLAKGGAVRLAYPDELLPWAYRSKPTLQAMA